jgi:hypothetical protein
MMTGLSLLSQALEQALTGIVHDLNFDLRPLQREHDQLEKWIGGRGAERPAQDVITAALLAFYNNRQFATLRQARLVSFGCLAPVLPRAQLLIEDEERFPQVLTGIDEYRLRPRAFRLCYRGLLYAYFGYDFEKAPKAGRENWQSLRAYLRERASATRTDGTLPAWVACLQSNRELLDDDPVRGFAQEMLESDAERFEHTRQTLDIHDSSWLIWHLVLGQIEVAANRSDALFKGHLPSLVALLTRHPLASDRGLARLLARYRECASHEVHPELRDFAVGQWGNPWLERNRVKWSLAHNDARLMVTTWLKLILIQQFFSLLAEDGRQDTRRLKFWEKYHQHIDDMYFALGPTAQNSRDKDFVDIRRKMEGRRLRLARGGSPENNAFVMFIGRYAVVEFGLKGNACFIFSRNALPFDLGGEVAGDRSGLKHASGERLLHMDRGGVTWEHDFRSHLSSRLAISPAAGGAFGARPQTASNAQPQRLVTPPGPPAWRPAPAPQSAGFADTRAAPPTPDQPAREAFSLRDISRLCSPLNIRIQDLRDQNGNLWVRADDADPALARQLEARPAQLVPFWRAPAGQHRPDTLICRRGGYHHSAGRYASGEGP